MSIQAVYADSNGVLRVLILISTYVDLMSLCDSDFLISLSIF